MKVLLSSEFWLVTWPDGTVRLSEPWVRGAFDGQGKPGMVAWPVEVLRAGEEIEVTRRDAGAPDGATAALRAEIADMVALYQWDSVNAEEEALGIADGILDRLRSAAEPARRAAP